jgi:outer membrane protein assembly factor BamE (lipoprotein component of BamABCDE complex)
MQLTLLRDVSQDNQVAKLMVRSPGRLKVKFCRIELRSTTPLLVGALALATLSGGLLAGCSMAPIQHGYVLSPDALSQVTVGSSREQVQLVLGSPSVTSSINGDAYYYISQTQVENPVMGRDIVDQNVLAIYFDDKGNVRDIGKYGLKDGKLFAFIERRTRATGAELSFIGQMFQGLGHVNPMGNLTNNT